MPIREVSRAVSSTFGISPLFDMVVALTSWRVFSATDFPSNYGRPHKIKTIMLNKI
jgi:hypothetical protein